MIINIKHLLFKLLLIFPVLFLSKVSQSQNLLNGPQKIVIDAPRNRLLVSNANTGDLVQIDSTGVQTFFVQGADFIDGLEIVGDIVYGVGSNRKIRAYNLVTAELILDITLPGSAAKYLSSITYDSAGCLFISCPLLNEIYRMRISDHSYWVFAKNNGLKKPNGILLEKEKNRIVVIDDSPNSSIIHAISLDDSSVSTLFQYSFDNPDGIIRDKYGNHFVCGYYLPGMYKFDSGFNQNPELFIPGNSMVYPTYDIRDHSILVTHYNENTWERIPLSTEGTIAAQIKDFPACLILPNPIRSSASIKIEIEKAAKVDLSIYDSVGLLVKTLINEFKEAGSYSAVWDCKDNTGKRSPNGLYYFRLVVDGITRVQKGILVD